MEQVLAEPRDASGNAGRAGTPPDHLQGTRGPVAFEVWQFRMYFSLHFTSCIFFLAIGLLQALATQQLHASLAGTISITAVYAPLRYAAHHAKNQELAHLVMEYFSFTLLAIRLIVTNFAVPVNSFEPLE
eukprot:6211806-Pleurochrysis_carterae.AAC.1